MANLSKQFYKSDLSECFLTNLDISDSQKKELIEARKTIRNHLRSGVEAFSITESGGGKRITPKFYTQGSWAYKTVNSPCFAPPQQVDYDDGMYLPVSYLDDNGPSVAAKVYFELVDSLLYTLCQDMKWTLDRTKKTCSRVIISSTSHFDIPLYSIPDKEFSAMLELKTKGQFTEMVVLDEAYEFSEEVWRHIASEKVLLAKRDGEWHPSDPRKIDKWFRDEVKTKGEQLRRICRYFKSWRDFRWEKGGPSSILMMILASELFIKEDGRDDIALLNILSKLPKRLLSPVFNPTDENECLTDRLNEIEIKQIVDLSSGFGSDLSKALSDGVLLDAACDSVKKHVGNRFPMSKENGTVKKESTALTGIVYPSVHLKKNKVQPWQQIR